MPKVNIAEIDKTGAEPAQYDDYIVLIPGKSLKAPTGYEKDFNSISDFNAVIGNPESEESGDVPANDISHKMARHLINLGMTVHFVVIEDEEDLDDEDFWGKYKDKGLYNLRFLTTGGYRTQEAAQHMIKCAAERGDAIALVDVPTPSKETFNTDYINTWLDSLVVADVVRANGVFENSFKYSACFPIEVTFKGETSYYPGSFAYLSCFAKHISRFPDWFAMAGSIRGVLPFEKVEVPADEVFGDADINKLQERNKEGFKASNPVCEIRPYGNIVWGNRTLYPITRGDDDSLGLRASNFLNIRNICCDIKKVLYRTARKYTFEPNSNVLWFNFIGDIKPLLEEMRSGQGIKGYKITKETTKEKATLKANIKIIPIEAVEDFDLTVELTDSISVTE